MKYREHIVVSLGLSTLWTIPFILLTHKTISLYQYLPMYFFILLGAIAPDIDHPKAYVSTALPKLVRRFSLIILSALFIKYASVHFVKLNTTLQRTADYIIYIALGLFMLPFVSLILNKWLTHRGPIHSIIVGIAIGAVMKIIGLERLYVIAFLSGWITHLYGDCWTGNGIALFWPYSKKKYIAIINYTTQQKYVNYNCAVALALFISGLAIILR